MQTLNETIILSALYSNCLILQSNIVRREEVLVFGVYFISPLFVFNACMSDSRFDKPFNELRDDGLIRKIPLKVGVYVFYELTKKGSEFLNKSRQVTTTQNI
jgi:hypothetical protein